MLHNAILLSYVLLAVGFSPIVIGVIVFARARNDPNGLYYFFLACTIAIWVSFTALFEIVSGQLLSTLFLNIYFLAANLVVLSLMYFAFSFTGKKLTIARVIFLALPAILIVFLISSSGDAFTVLPLDPRSFGKSFSYSYVFPLIGVYFTFYLSLSVYLLYKHYFSSAGVFRQREKIIFFIVMTSSAVGFIANFIVPLFGNTELFFVGTFFVTGGVYFFGFFLAKHNLWNMRIFITQIFDTIVILALGVSVFFSTTIGQYTIKSLFFLLVAGTAIYLYRNMQKESEAEERVEGLLRQLTERHEDLAALDRRTSVFVTTTANQLRDPLSGIRWHASSLLQGSFGALPDQSREYVNRIFESSKRLIAIVDDFLDLREIEQGKMNYIFSYFDLKPMVVSVVEETTSLAQEKKLFVTYSDDSSASYPVYADQGKIRQVVSNLIDNAIKYSEKGTIRVHLEVRGDSIATSISDCGIGLEAGEIGSLFRKFNRMREAKKVNAGGSGLGLYIAQQIAKAHDGHITVMSEGSGKGSTFTLTIPKNVKR